MNLLLRSLAEEDRAIILHSEDIWKVLTKSFTEGVVSQSGGRGVMTDSEIYLHKPAFEVENITHPIHYWHGGDDKNIPAALVQELACHMPPARLHIEENLGHFSLAIHRAAAALDHIGEPRLWPAFPQPMEESRP